MKRYILPKILDPKASLLLTPGKSKARTDQLSSGMIAIIDR
jgi:hypothetical protein